MSNPSEFELDLDLQLLPAWARQPSTDNRYAKFEGGPGTDRGDRRGDRFGRREPRRDRPPRRDGGPPGRRGPEESRGERGRPGAGGRRFEPRRDRDESREAPTPLPDIDVNLTPEEKGVESLARQIKLTGRAYPLFDIAALILKRPERFHVEFTVPKKPEGQTAPTLVVCSLDESLWLSEDEVVAHALRKHFDTFYQTEKVATDPPKGTYTFVAQCGLSGTILGPPNYHDYQNKLHKLHTERFNRMPFDSFKARVKIVRDEAVVKQWVDDQSWKTEFIGLNLPEPVKLANRDEVERHFRETHLPNLVRTVERLTLRAGDPRPPMSATLLALQRRAVEDQRRFPLRLATVLSQQFASHGLQFFKVNRTVTHVCVARPHYLDLETTVVSETVRRIVEYINAHSGCTRRQMIEALAPTPPQPQAPPAPTAPAPVPPPTADAPTAPGAAEPSPSPTTSPAEPVPAAAAPAAPAAESGPQPTPEQTAIIADLHWLIHQGHVIEFTNGRMETAKAPKPKPPTPPPAPKTVPPVSPAPADPTPADTPVEMSPEPTAEASSAGPAGSEATPDLAPAPVPEHPTPETPAAALERPMAEVPAPVPPPPSPSAPPSDEGKPVAADQAEDPAAATPATDRPEPPPNPVL